MSPQALRVRNTFFLIDITYKGGHAIHLTVLIVTLAWASNDLRLAVWAYLVQQFIEPIAEVITGQFADQKGRRIAVVLGVGLLAVAGLFFCLTTLGMSVHKFVSYILVLTGQGAYLLGSAFISGALEAWAVDTIRYFDGDEVNLDDIFTSLSIYNNIAMAIGGVVGLCVAIVFGNYWLPWLIMTATMSILTVYAARTMIEPSRTLMPVGIEEKTVPQRHDSSFKQAFQIIRENRRVMSYITAWAFQYSLWVLVAYFWVDITSSLLAPYHMNRGSVPLLLLWGTLCTSRIVGAFLVRNMVTQRKYDGIRLLIVCSLFNALPIAVYELLRPAISGGWVYELFYFGAAITVSKIFEVMIIPLRSTRINLALTDSSVRALCLSLSSALGAAMAFIILVVYSAFRRHLPGSANDIHGWLALTSAVASVSALLYWRIGQDAVLKIAIKESEQAPTV